MDLIALLEDDDRRTEAMLAAQLPATIIRFDNAPDMLAWLPENLSGLTLIALDHDLGPSRLREGERFEPGIGRDIANYLATQKPTCQVLIHSTNGPAADGMQFCLEAVGWSVTRVYPYDDLAWIERDWAPEIRRLAWPRGLEQ